MKMLSPRKANGAMTLLEVLVVIIVIVILMSFFLPGLSNPGHMHRTPLDTCRTHLRQIDIAFIMYASDSNGHFPMQVFTNDGGTQEIRDQTFPHYQKLSGYLLYVPTLVCPADKNRGAAENYAQLTDTNLSYFINVDASTNNPSTTILAGDRNLQSNGRAVPSGSFTLTRSLDMGWTRELHPNMGILAFADGHAEISQGVNLNLAVRRQRLGLSHLSIP